MANLLDLVDQLIGSILQGNIYTDVSTFRPKVPQSPNKPLRTQHPSSLNFPGPQHPVGTIPQTNNAGQPIHGAIGRTNDPRNLNFQGTQHPEQVIPEGVHSQIGATNDPRNLNFPGPEHPDRKSTRLNSSHSQQSRMPSSA